MRYTLLSQSPQNRPSSLSQGRVTAHAVGGAIQAGDALSSGHGAQPPVVAGQQGAGKYMREYRQRKERDRRQHCRRIQTGHAMLIELRSGVERRGGSRRRGEPTMHIRVKV